MKKILIVKLGAIGDVLRTTSILPGLQKKYFPVSIDWLTSPTSQDVLINNPYVHNLLVWEQKETLGEYDIVIGLEDDKEACELVSGIKSEKIIGSYAEDGKQTYTPSAWFDMSVISKYGLDEANRLKKKNTKTFQRHLAELLGVQVGSYVFGLKPDEVEYGRKHVKALGIGKRERVVGINTGAGKRWPLKSLSIEKTIDLINRLRKEMGVVSLVLGGPDEKDRNEIISKETDMPNGGLHSLRNFAAVINQCQVLVASDSLALHFGIALSRRIVVFFGPTSPAEIELYGLGSKIFPDIDCLVCYKKNCDKNPSCMDVLEVEDLFFAVKKELERA